jgi:hypothetical protein
MASEPVNGDKDACTLGCGEDMKCCTWQHGVAYKAPQGTVLLVDGL